MDYANLDLTKYRKVDVRIEHLLPNYILKNMFHYIEDDFENDHQDTFNKHVTAYEIFSGELIDEESGKTEERLLVCYTGIPFLILEDFNYGDTDYDKEVINEDVAELYHKFVLQAFNTTLTSKSLNFGYDG